jgi:hypothetical protein
MVSLEVGQELSPKTYSQRNPVSTANTKMEMSPATNNPGIPNSSV